MGLKSTIGWVLLAAVACGAPDRKNPNDPRGTDESTGEAIQLVARLPEGGTGGVSDVLAQIRYAVSGPGLPAAVEGRMDLIGRSARARVAGVPPGEDRVFRVTAMDPAEVITFAVVDTVDITADLPQTVELQLRRLGGSLELTSELPPEIVELEVNIDAMGDTLLRRYDVSGALVERIDNIPTGGDIGVVLKGYDAEAQVLIQQAVKTDIRTDLVARISLEVVGGFLQIVAHFPEYIPIVEIDRFSDEMGVFFRRTDNPDLPAPNAPIDFDDPQFRIKAFGPNGEMVEYYNFDVRPKVPAIAYIAVDRRDDQIPGQLPVFTVIPGDEGYSDFVHIHYVRIIDRDYRANSITDAEDIVDSDWEIIPTDQVMQAVMVPDGSMAALRFDATTPSALLDGWYKGQVVKYLLFEHPASTAVVDFGAGEINTPQMYAFFANNRNVKDGFEVDPQTGMTHNVVTRLPGQEGYSPLWVLQVFKLVAFDRVQDLASALDQSKVEESKVELESLLYLNAPVVGMGGASQIGAAEPEPEQEPEPEGEEENE